MSKLEYIQYVENHSPNRVNVGTNQRTFEGVSYNVVRCTLGRDMEYFERRNFRSAADMSRRLTAVEAADFEKFSI